MIRFILVQVCLFGYDHTSFSSHRIQNRQGKTRLSKWYVPYDDEEKVRYLTPFVTCARITFIGSR